MRERKGGRWRGRKGEREGERERERERERGEEKKGAIEGKKLVFISASLFKFNVG